MEYFLCAQFFVSKQKILQDAQVGPVPVFRKTQILDHICRLLDVGLICSYYSPSLAKYPFKVIALLEKFCQTCLLRNELNHPVFTSLNFGTVFSFYRARLSALRRTPNLEDQVSFITDRPSPSFGTLEVSN
jgi:hypothetical protein